MMTGLLILTALAGAQVDRINPIHPGPCAAELAQIQRQLVHSRGNTLEGPTARETVAAELHHQPTPQSVRKAELTAKAEFQSTIARARRANAAGDVAACNRALDKAKELYGLS